MKLDFIIKSLLIVSLLFPSCVPIQQTIKPPENWTTTDKGEPEFKLYFDQHLNILDPIEGIWSMSETTSWINVVSGIKGKIENASQYRIAVMKDENINDLFYGYVLESRDPEWTKGKLKVKYRKTAFDMAYEQFWFMQDYSEKVTNAVIENKGFIRGTTSWANYPINYERETILLKIYPSLKSNSATNISSESKSSSSGFLISESGLIVTNYHAVENSNLIEVVFPTFSKKYISTIKIKDVKNDITILELKDFVYSSIFDQSIPYSFIDANSVKIGEEVFTLGFPFGDIMGSKSRLSTGRINSQFGIQDDPRLFQISNPLQPGNSGGPLFNNKGELVGLVVSSLNAKYFYENVGVIPQNVNFAIKSTYLQNLISMMPEGNNILKRKNLVKQSKMEEQIEQLNPFVVQIKVY
ncbi:MAG: serine protease [Melioribacteraceae bacterium]